MGIIKIKHEDLSFGGANSNLAMFRYTKVTKSYLGKCRLQKVCLEYSILMLFFLLHLLFLCFDSPWFCLCPLDTSLPHNILPSFSPISPPPRKRPSPMCGHLKPKRLTFETERSVFSKPRIQLLLPMKIERPANLTLDKTK